MSLLESYLFINVLLFANKKMISFLFSEKILQQDKRRQPNQHQLLYKYVKPSPTIIASRMVHVTHTQTLANR